jgi:diguanylate cyclase (GGDEF)-like protein
MSLIEVVTCLQLALYAAGWAVAAAFIREERKVLLHWSAYALLQSLSVVAAPGAFEHGAQPQPVALLASALGFAVALRGVDLFAHGRATLDRWFALPMAGLALVLVVAPLLALPAASQRVLIIATYGATVALMLGVATPCLWKGLVPTAGRLATAVALSPGAALGLLAGVSTIMVLALDPQDNAQVRGTVRPANVVASFVTSAVFNFAYLFLLMARFIRRLHHLARHDHLTGAFNRREIESVLEVAWHQHRRLGSGLAVALVDVDHFKRLNDTLGHAGGDRALVRVAQLLRERTRPYDRVGRWGGEEFLLVMVGADAATAVQVCERLRVELSESSQAALGVPLTVSIGVAAAHDDATAAALIERADRAMYEAKASGRDRVGLAGADPGPGPAATPA